MNSERMTTTPQASKDGNGTTTTVGGPRPVLSLFDSTSLIVGIIIGVGIYQMSPDVARAAGGPWGIAGFWLAGGLLSLCGALCYAELASAYPQSGGDVVYLTRAYGRWAGFLFGWAQLIVVRPGDIAVMAFAFATYAITLSGPLPGVGTVVTEQLYASGAVIVFTVLNILGVKLGARAQNALTLAKALGLLLLVGAALRAEPFRGAVDATDPLPAGLAMIFVLFTFGGWNEMAYVAAEVRDSRRNIARAIVLGLVTVTGLYLLAQAAFLHVLGFDGLRASRAAAHDTLAAVFPLAGGPLISVLICLSALGATNGLILTGARISFALGREHSLFGGLGRWHAGRNTPATALAAQGALAVVLIALLGSLMTAVLYTAAVVYGFYMATTLAVIVLRRRDPGVPRPFRVPGYPLTPLVFAAVCLYLIRSAVLYKPWIAGGAVVLLLAGFLFYRPRIESCAPPPGSR